MQNGSYKTYTSTLASSNSSRAFSLVGCHIGMSKYLTRKGQTTLSRTKNKKNLPQREMRNKGIDITKTMGWNSLQKSGQYIIRFANSTGIVDRMNDVLVQEVNLFLDSSFERVAEMKNAMCQAQANGKKNRDYLQIDFVIEQFAKGLFAGGLQKDHSEK